MLSVAEDHFGLHLLYRFRGAEKSRTGVVVIALDRASAKKPNLPAAPHKWPRSLYARLLDQLVSQGTTAVVFDLIFQEPQQTARSAKVYKSFAQGLQVFDRKVD